MRHWNYRVVRRVTGSGDESSVVYAIHECYYDSQGKVCSFSEKPSAACGETLEELCADLDRMANAFNSPVLEYANLPETGARVGESSEEFSDEEASEEEDSLSEEEEAEESDEEAPEEEEAEEDE